VSYVSFVRSDATLKNKLTTGISNQLKNQAINKTEGLVNDKANKFLNAFGAGRSEVSINGVEPRAARAVPATFLSKVVAWLSCLMVDCALFQL
jgi:hypothetical protein